MSDEQIAGLVGSPVRLVRGWLRELGEAGIYSVSEDGKLYSSRMVRAAEFAKRAQEDGKKGQALKKARRLRPPIPPELAAAHKEALEHGYIPINSPLIDAAIAEGKRASTEINVRRPPKFALADNATEVGPGTQAGSAGAAPAPTAQAAPAHNNVKRAAAWWLSPAGWVRKGNEQALSMQAGEDFKDFQVRLAARIPPGRHLDVLSPSQLRAVEAKTPKLPEKKEAAA